MRYRVVITELALGEVQEAFAWLLQKAPLAAQRWRGSLLEAVSTLETSPGRCPRAPEADYLGREIRQLLHGKRRGVYRILFEVRGNIVCVLRVRHSSRQLLTPDE